MITVSAVKHCSVHCYKVTDCAASLSMGMSAGMHYVRVIWTSPLSTENISVPLSPATLQYYQDCSGHCNAYVTNLQTKLNYFYNSAIDRPRYLFICAKPEISMYNISLKTSLVMITDSFT